MKRFIGYSIRLLLFIMVVYIFMRHADTKLLLKVCSQVSVTWLIPAFLFYFTRTLISGIRWRLAAKAYGHILPYKPTIRAQLEIIFLEIVFPIPDSEDGLKMTYMFHQKIPLSASTAIILYDRMIGISILLLLLPFSFLFFLRTSLPPYLHSPWILSAFIFAMSSIVIFHRVLLSWLIKFIQLFFPFTGQWTRSLQQELQKKISFPLLFLCIALTFIYALCGTAAAWLLVKSLNEESSFALLLAGIPIYYLSAILPISIQGLGLYEAALVFMLQQQNVPSEVAFAVGLLHLIFHIIMIALGGISYLFNIQNHFTDVSFMLAPLRKLMNRKISPSKP
jgi:uncharacterized membrane protein YbhN (UPF0104 family)